MSFHAYGIQLSLFSPIDMEPHLLQHEYDYGIKVMWNNFKFGARVGNSQVVVMLLQSSKSQVAK